MKLAKVFRSLTIRPYYVFNRGLLESSVPGILTADGLFASPIERFLNRVWHGLLKVTQSGDNMQLAAQAWKRICAGDIIPRKPGPNRRYLLETPRTQVPMKTAEQEFQYKVILENYHKGQPQP